jgi:arylsulfatase A-like enzyme
MRAITGLLLLLGVCPGAIVAEELAKRPNIIFLMTDNQRCDALGCYGNTVVRTPHVDRLAAQGVRFSNAFCTTSICSASRASILTGQYRRVHGYSFETPPMSTMAMRASYPWLLRNAGYRTGFVGKIGVDLEAGASDEMFDFARFTQASGTKEPYYRRAPDGDLKHLTEINGDHAIEFLRTSAGAAPFCLSVSFSAPHPEDDNPQQYIYDRHLEHLYRDATIPVPPVSQPRYFDQLPEFLQVSMNRQRWFRRFDTPEKYQAMMKGMYRLITGVDTQVGRIVDEIEQLGVAENTVIIYTSDNGLLVGEHGITGIWLMYEPSIRLPLVIYDPRLPSNRKGKVASELALNVDYAATLVDLAGVDRPDALQGRSLTPLLRGRGTDWPIDFFYEHDYRPSHIKTNQNNIPRSEGVRTERWKYVHYFDEQPVYEQLFDLINDPHEVRNLALESGHDDTLKDLRERVLVLRAKHGTGR